MRTRRDERDYQSDLDLELADVAKVCAALVRADAAFESRWQEMQVKLDTQYGGFEWHTTVSYTQVKMDRETLESLRFSETPASEFPRHWQFVYASKVVPLHSTSWREWWPADIAAERNPSARPTEASSPARGTNSTSSATGSRP